MVRKGLPGAWGRRDETVRALDADTVPGSVSERDVGGSLCTAWWLPERMLTRSTGAANESLTGEPAGTSSQRLLMRACGVRTARCSRNVRPSTQLTGAERVIVAVITTFSPTGRSTVGHTRPSRIETGIDVPPGPVACTDSR